MAQPAVTDSQVRLVRQAASGDQQAFADLFSRYYETVYNYCLWMCRDPAQAADVTQETFIQAYKNLGQLGPPWNFRAWLYRMARNRFVDHLRAERETETLDDEQAIPTDHPDPESHVSQAERARHIRRIIERLPDQHREALTLREFGDLSYEEIAETMGISLSYVRVLLHRARALFRQHYTLRLLAEDRLPDCPVLGDLLDAFHDDSPMIEDEYRRIEAHINDCERCQQRRRELIALILLIRGLPLEAPPRGLKSRILKQTAGEQGKPGAGRLWFGLAAATVVLVLGGLYFSGRFDSLLDDLGGFGGGGEPEDDATATPESCGDSVCAAGREDAASCPADCSVSAPAVNSSPAPEDEEATPDSTPTGAATDLCAENGGVQYQGEVCVCSGYVDQVTICNDGTKFDHVTEQTCSPDPASCVDEGGSDDEGPQCGVKPCGNGVCQPECGENKASCPADCP